MAAFSNNFAPPQGKKWHVELQVGFRCRKGGGGLPKASPLTPSPSPAWKAVTEGGCKALPAQGRWDFMSPKKKAFILCFASAT